MKMPKLTGADLPRRLLPFSGPIQADAAAGLEEDKVLCDGSGFRVVEGLREEEDARKGENEEDRPCLFIRRQANMHAQKTRRVNESYPARWTPRFSEDIKAKIR